MIYLYGIFSLTLIIYGVTKFTKSNSNKVFSFILIFLGLQFSFEFIDILQRSIFVDLSSTALNFSVIEMSLDKLNLFHLIILVSGTLSLIFGNMFYKSYFLSNKSNRDFFAFDKTEKDHISNVFFYFIFILPSFFICLLLLYQFILIMGGLSAIFQNIGMYRSGAYSGTGSGYFLYPSLIVFPALIVYFLIHNKYHPSNYSKTFHYLSLFGMYILLLFGTLVSGFRIHLLLWTFLLFVMGIIGSKLNIKVTIIAIIVGLFIIMLGVLRALIEGANEIEIKNLIEILVAQLNRVPSLSLIALTEFHIIPRFEYLLQFMLEPLVIWLFPALWATPLVEAYAYDIAYEYLYFRSGNVTNLNGISANPILFFYWMLGAIFMPLVLFIFGFLSGICDALLSNQSKSSHLFGALIAMFLIYSLENPPGSIMYIFYIGIIWTIIALFEKLIINTTKNILHRD